MNTQHKLSPIEFNAFRTAFKAKAANKTLTSTDIILYNWVRSLPLSRGFSPITCPSKLNNGHHPRYALHEAMRNLRYRVSHSNKWATLSAQEYQTQIGLSPEQAHLLANDLSEALECRT